MPRPFHVEYQPRLMISVRDAAEAAAALAGGADVVDVVGSDPGAAHGPDPARIAAVAKVVAGNRPVSVNLGIVNTLLPDQGLRNSRMNGVPDGLTFVRIGLAHAPADWESRLDAAFAFWRPARGLVVAYADAARTAARPIERVFAWAAEHQVAGLFIDTAMKDDKDLFAWLDRDTLRELVMQARHRSMLVAVAGGLTAESLEQAVQTAPDIIAVRGAACAGGDRNGVIDTQRVTQLRGIIAECTEAAAWK